MRVNQYWNEIEAVGIAVKTEVAEGRDMNEVIDEIVGAHEYVVYPKYHAHVLHFTECEDALFDNGGDLSDCTTAAAVLARLATAAFAQDILCELTDD